MSIADLRRERPRQRQTRTRKTKLCQSVVKPAKNCIVNVPAAAHLISVVLRGLLIVLTFDTNINYPTTIARAQEDATITSAGTSKGDVCACSPTTYTFRLDFSSTCPPTNTNAESGVASVSCLISPFGAPSDDLVPVIIESVGILELDQGKNVLVEERIDSKFLNGDSLLYSSVVKNLGAAISDEEIPKALQVNLSGRNKEGIMLMNVFIITFTNECGVFPMIQTGGSVGWVIFSQVTDPIPGFCPTLVPSSSPSPFRQPISRPTISPTQKPVTPQPTRPPTLDPTASPSKCPTERPTDEPTFKKTRNPTRSPTKVTTTFPPTTRPTHVPTQSPVKSPSEGHTDGPTFERTRRPTRSPHRKLETKHPSRRPTNEMSMLPTKNPIGSPIKKPTREQTRDQSSVPSEEPSSISTLHPTTQTTERLADTDVPPEETPTGQSHEPTKPIRKPTLSSKLPTDKPAIARRPTNEPSSSQTEYPMLPTGSPPRSSIPTHSSTTLIVDTTMSMSLSISGDLTFSQLFDDPELESMEHYFHN